MTNGNEVEQQTFDGASTQKWKFVYHSEGNVYTIRSAQNNSCYLGVENNSTADGANIVLRTGSIQNGMKWRIMQGNEGWKICAFSDTSMVLATNSSNATAGQKLILGDWVDNDSYRDEWDFYDTVFSYVNYYDSTFTGSNSYLVNYIADANSLANLVFSSCFNVGFRMDGNAVQRNDIIADTFLKPLL